MADHKGKEPHVLFCDAHKGNSSAYCDGYERTFGKKPLPHGRKDRKHTIYLDWPETFGLIRRRSNLAWEEYVQILDGNAEGEHRRVENRTYAFRMTREDVVDLGGHKSPEILAFLECIEKRAFLAYLLEDEDTETNVGWELFHKPQNCYAERAYLIDVRQEPDRVDLGEKILDSQSSEGLYVYQIRVPWEVLYAADTEEVQFYARFAFTRLVEGEEWLNGKKNQVAVTCEHCHFVYWLNFGDGKACPSCGRNLWYLAKKGSGTVPTEVHGVG